MPNVSLVGGHVDEPKDYPSYLDRPKKPITNYDRIRNMSKLELGNFLSEIQYQALEQKSKYACEWEKWLESEVDGE